MKATGIVRRIDDLGRIVIPKEIRKQMRIREGDALEIYTDSDGYVCFKKYSPIGEEIPQSLLCELITNLTRTIKRAVLFVDGIEILASTSADNGLKTKNKYLDDVSRCIINNVKYCYRTNVTIEGDVIGHIIVLGEDALATCQIDNVLLTNSMIEGYIKCRD